MLAPTVSLTAVRGLVHAAGQELWSRATGGLRDAVESASLMVLPAEMMKMADAGLFDDLDGYDDAA
jgi:hypothetical protein